jgi:uncharacterized membrane protein
LAGRAVVRIPVWFWLGAIVVASAVFRAILTRGIVAPFIMVDEVIWAELARGIASSGELVVRGESDPGYGFVYPLVISPAYAFFDTLPDAYAAVKVLNSAVMSLAAVPAYFLARRVVGESMSLLAALLTVALPSLAYTGTVMTENLFYPLFLAVALVLVLVLERPTGLRVGVLVGLLVIAYATRVQAAALVPAALLTPIVLALFQKTGLRRTISRFRLLYGVFAGLALLVLVVQIAAGRSLGDLLGAYSPVRNARYDVDEVLRYLLWHAGELSLYLLVVPVIATVLLVARARSVDERLQAFLAALIALTLCFVPVVAAFASVFSDRIEERNLFYLAPLYVITLVAWVDRGAPRPRLLAPIATAVCALLVVVIPFDRFIATSAITDTLMLLPFWSMQDHIGSGWTRPAAGAFAAGLGAVFLLVPRRQAIMLPLLVLALWGVALKPIWWGTHGFERFSEGSLFQGIRASDRDWIDRALPSDVEAAFLWTGRADRLTVNQDEFFNRGVGSVYYLVDPTPGGLPESQVHVDRESGAVTLSGGTAVTDRYLVSDSSFEPDGRPIAHDKGWGITLWRVRPPLVSASRIDGLYPNDTWSGKRVSYLRRRCVAGRLLVFLSSDASLFLEPQTVVARSNGREVARIRIRPVGRVALDVPVRPAPGRAQCQVDFTVTPTAIPAEVTGGQSKDRRVLGAHFEGFIYAPAAAP